MTVKNNLRATTDPSTTDDSSAGYARGSHWWNDTKGVLFVCTDPTASTAVWLRQGTRKPHPYSQSWMMPAHLAGMSQTSSLVVSSLGVAGSGSVLYLTPFDLPEKLTIEAIGTYLNTAGSAGAAQTHGIYAHNPTTNKPDGGARLYQTGASQALDSTTGGRTNTGLSVALNPGLVWVATLVKDVATMPIMSRIFNTLPGWIIGTNDNEINGSINGGNFWRYYSAEMVWSTTLPSTCPVTAAGSGICPVQRIRPV